MKLPTAKEAVILHLLRVGERYALEMVSAAEPELKRGTVYVTLQRMERAGLVESRQLDGDANPARRYYRATERGRRLLRARNAAIAVLGDYATPGA